MDSLEGKGSCDEINEQQVGNTFASHGPSISQRGVHQLSCTSCRDRKLKCNRLVPCSNCVSYGVVCLPVYRRRLPRGRYAHSARRNPSPSSGDKRQVQEDKQASLAAANAELNKRIQRLESFIAGLGSTTAVIGKNEQAGKSPQVPALEDSGTQSHISPVPCSVIDPADGKLGNFQNYESHYFSEELVDKKPRTSMESGNADISHRKLSELSLVDAFDGSARALGLLGSNQNFEPCAQGKMPVGELCQIFLQNVDPLVKILHRPTLSNWMLQGGEYPAYPDGHPSLEALRSAVCYAAAMSLSEDQSQAIFHISKTYSVLACQKACETAISKSGLLTSLNIVTLQAFVLYLISRRAHDKSMAVWTLIAVAVRSARSLGLHQAPGDPSTRDESFFDQQTRKRLWLTICLMDIQSSVAQLSEPLISYQEAASALAHVQHINDSDFDPTTATPVNDREGLTDTTFTLINYQVELAGSPLSFPPSNLACDSNTGTVVAFPGLPYEQEVRESRVRRFEQASLRLLQFCDPESSTYAWYIWHSIHALVAAVRFAALSTYSHQTEDIHRDPNFIAQYANSVEGGKGNTELLRRALSCLKKMQIIHTDSRCGGFRWYMSMPWAALAVAIVECSICTDLALVHRAWPLLQEWYQVYKSSRDVVLSAELVTLMEQMQASFQGSQQSAQQLSGVESSQAPSEHSIPDITSPILLTGVSDSVDVPRTSSEADMSLVCFENSFKADSNMQTHILSPHVWDVSSYIINP